MRKGLPKTGLALQLATFGVMMFALMGGAAGH